MPRFEVGDQAWVLCNTAHKGEVGTIIDIALCASGDEPFHSYLVQFDTSKGRVEESFLQYELYDPLPVTHGKASS